MIRAYVRKQAEQLLKKLNEHLDENCECRYARAAREAQKKTGGEKR